MHLQLHWQQSASLEALLAHALSPLHPPRAQMLGLHPRCWGCTTHQRSFRPNPALPLGLAQPMGFYFCSTERTPLPRHVLARSPQPGGADLCQSPLCSPARAAEPCRDSSYLISSTSCRLSSYFFFHSLASISLVIICVAADTGRLGCALRGFPRVSPAPRQGRAAREGQPRARGHGCYLLSDECEHSCLLGLAEADASQGTLTPALVHGAQPGIVLGE